MLVLARKPNEKIIIETPSGEMIEITLVSVSSANVTRLGIEAPVDFHILRTELLIDERACKIQDLPSR